MSISPEFYVIRLSPSTWGITPFDENVASNVAEIPPKPMGFEETKAVIKEVPVSVWLDGIGDDVDWCQGEDVNLLSMKVCTYFND